MRIPIKVIASNCHQPDLPTSCNLLQATEIEGKIKMIFAKETTLPSPKSVDKANPTMTQKRLNHQYSLRLARPVNVAYFLKQVEIDSVNVIVF